jgi:hypothetical protein
MKGRRMITKVKTIGQNKKNIWKEKNKWYKSKGWPKALNKWLFDKSCQWKWCMW